MNNIIAELVAALDEEIVALKQGRGGSITKIFNGKFIRDVPNGFVYVFHLENFLATLDDVPAEIEINHRQYSAQVLLTQGLEVEICIENFCGEFVAEARLHTNLWYLLELLKKKLLESINQTEKFKLSNALFSVDSSEFPVNTYAGELQFSPSSTNQPNPSQQRAIEASFQKGLSIIWGPPGTGKTTTIAKAIEAHLNAGRKVLLVSHANNAVDQALMDVAEQMKITPYYENGELVRLGTPTDPVIYKELEDKYEMVLMDRIAGRLGASMVVEKNQLLKKKAEIDERINNLRAASALFTQLDSLISQSKNTEQAIQQYTSQLSQVDQQLEQLGQSQQANRRKLREAQSSGALKKIFRGLNSQSIQKEIDRITISIDSQQRLATGLRERLEVFQKSHSEAQQNIKKTQAEKDEFLKLLSIDYPEQLEKINLTLDNELQEIQKRIAEIDKSLDELQKSILGKARLVATTLTKTFSDRKFESLNFDVLFVDEASMAPLPYVYWAVGKCKQVVTIVGDFLQLPPIVVSDGPMSRKWLARSIFSVLDIDTVEKADKHQLVTLLDTQYRMVPEIAEIPRSFFYDGKLKNGEITKTKKSNDGISKNPLVLIKTERMNPWCSRLSTSGRFNLYNALVSATLAKNIFDKGYAGKIGIITPYAAQARLTNYIAKDWGLLENLHISTIHRFQGGEEATIIFDTVEATGTQIAPMLDGTRAGSDADLLLNVAITRAESKFYLVAHTSHLLSELNPNSSLTRLIKYFEKNGEIKESDEFVDNYLVTDFEKYTQAPPISQISQNDGNLFTEKNFWMQFDQDLNTVQERLIILSPFLSIRRSDHFMNRFQALLAKGVQVFIYTRPKNQQIGDMVHQAEVVIEHMLAIGVKVIERKSMHQKVAIVDDRIAWEGSLNILSHRDTGEQMRRLEGQATTKELIKNLDLEGSDAVGNYSVKFCPVCSNPLVYRQSKYGKFLGCSDFPRCKYIEKRASTFKRKFTRKSHR